MSPLVVVSASVGAGVFAAAVPLVARSRLSTSPGTRAMLGRPIVLLSSAVVGGGVTAVLAWRAGAQLLVLTAGWLAVIGPALVVMDVTERRLPNLLTLGSYPVIVTILTAASVVDGSRAVLARAGLGVLVVGGFFLLVALLAPGGMGAGDVKLAGLTGLALGTHSVTAAVAAMLLGLLLGSGCALITFARHRRTDANIALGPALLCGALTVAIGISS